MEWMDSLRFKVRKEYDEEDEKKVLGDLKILRPIQEQMVATWLCQSRNFGTFLLLVNYYLD